MGNHVTLGVSYDSNGNYIGNQAGAWTTITPSSVAGGDSFDTTIIYVSTTDGSDSNTGLTVTPGPNGPLKSLIAACALVKSLQYPNGRPNWILLKGGDVWDGETLETAYSALGGSDNFSLGGLSPGEPMVIANYDPNFPTSPNPSTVPRAVIKVPGNKNSTAANLAARPGMDCVGSGFTGFIAVMGIEFYSSQRDPSSGDYVGDVNVGNSSNGIVIPSQPPIMSKAIPNFFLIENCKFMFLFNGFSCDVWNNLIIRRCAFQHNWGISGNPQGMAVDGVNGTNGFILEEVALDSNGQTGTLLGGNTQARNVYIQWSTFPTTAQGNISSRSASEGFQFRGNNMLVHDNFVTQNTYGFDVGHFQGMPVVTQATITNNVILQSTALINPDGSEDGQRGVGINFQNCSGSGVAATNNIIAHVLQTSPLAADGFDADGANTALGAGSLTFYSTGSGGTPGPYNNVSLSGGSGAGATANFTVSLDGTVHYDGFVLANGGAGYKGAEFLTAAPGSISGLQLYVSVNASGVIQTLAIAAGGSGGSAGLYTEVPMSGGSGTGAKFDFTISADGTVHIYDWNRSPTAGDGGSGYAIGNIVSAAPGSPNAITSLQFLVNNNDTSGTSGIQVTNNIVYDWWNYKADAGTGNNFSNIVDLRTPTNIEGYVDPNRTIGGYASTLGLTATIDGFMTAAIGVAGTSSSGNQKYNWQYALTGHAVNEWFRAGFTVAGIQVVPQQRGHKQHVHHNVDWRPAR